MRFKKRLIYFLTTFSIFGLFQVTQSTEINRTNADIEPTQRRIYAYPENAMDKDGWGDDDIWISFKNPSNVWSSRSLMTLAVADFFLGLVYADVPSDSTAIEFFSDNTTTNSLQRTGDITLTSTNLFQGFKIINSYVGGFVNVFQEKILLSAAQFSGILYHIDSCVDNFASGYNSYEQIIKTFIIDGTQIMGDTERKNISTTAYFDVAYNQTFSLSQNRTQSITLAQKLHSIRLASNSSRSLSLEDIGGYREFVLGGTATPAGWTNNATSQKLTYNVSEGKYTFSNISLSVGDFRILEFGSWDNYNVGFSHLTSSVVGFSVGLNDNNIYVRESGVGNYNVELTFQREGNFSVPKLSFVKI
jgi:hypothetical protein